MLETLKLNRHLDRVSRDALIPLTKITLLCGPNGSGKSTFLEALSDLITGKDSKNFGKPWTAKTAPVIVSGQCLNVLVYSFEKDNPRGIEKREMSNDEFLIRLVSREKSHGQSNFRQLETIMSIAEVDVLVLDEPESALDLDGLLWLRQQIIETDKQIILATHSPILLGLRNEPGGSIQIFGSEEGYADRIVDSCLALMSGKKPPRQRKRLPVFQFAGSKQTHRKILT